MACAVVCLWFLSSDHTQVIDLATYACLRGGDSCQTRAGVRAVLACAERGRRFAAAVRALHCVTAARSSDGASASPAFSGGRRAWGALCGSRRMGPAGFLDYWGGAASVHTEGASYHIRGFRRRSRSQRPTHHKTASTNRPSRQPTNNPPHTKNTTSKRMSRPFATQHHTSSTVATKAPQEAEGKSIEGMAECRGDSQTASAPDATQANAASRSSSCGVMQ